MEAYKKRIVKTIQYIDSHIDEVLSLEKIAEVSAYSPFHFHRIFKLVTGETLQNYIIRKRIEKSALHLALHKNMELRDIYWDLGFSSHSVFCKTFKKYYGLAPTEFRRSAPEKFHRILHKQSKNGQANTVFQPIHLQYRKPVKLDENEFKNRSKRNAGNESGIRNEPWNCQCRIFFQCIN
ncbi:helix-turn-helix domain-containing protein [Chryseobacterium sp. 22458]|uniref:helix-turn-helix domain-containing protein n=1 Tax=Chryseobacterium sp. 22458 TaxID=3453921 RepID=UPI003F833162